MKRLLPILIALALAYLGVEFAQRPTAPVDGGGNSPASESRTPQRDRGSSAERSTESAREHREPRANEQFESEGTVVKVLADDRKGSRHQRFIVKLPSGRTVLIAHNIDLAPRVENLREGDTVSFSGEFEDNTRGGVVHWTHHDPAGRHVAGWIRHQGRTYQ